MLQRILNIFKRNTVDPKKQFVDLVRTGNIKKMEELLPYVDFENWSYDELMNFGERVRWDWETNNARPKTKHKYQQFINTLAQRTNPVYNEEILVTAFEYSSPMFLQAFSPLVPALSQENTIELLRGRMSEEKINTFLDFLFDKTEPTAAITQCVIYNYVSLFHLYEENAKYNPQTALNILHQSPHINSDNPLYNIIAERASAQQRDIISQALPDKHTKERRKM